MKAVEIENLNKSYQNGTVALKGVNVQIDTGDCFALLGPNGAGKSTTIGIIASLVNKSSGKVKVFSHDLDKDPGAVKRCIGLVPQEFNFNVFERVDDILIQQAGYYGIDLCEAKQQAQKYLKLLDLWGKRRDFAKNLSGGMKRRLMIARALMHDPQLLILDEPTAGVDIEIRHSMYKFIKDINQNGTTIILTTHYLEEVEELCKNIAIIDQGEILANTSLKKLLAMSKNQTFVLDLVNPVEKNLQMPQLSLRHIDPTTLEVTISKHMSLNDLFKILSDHHISVASMRVKGNRIENLFLEFVKQGKKHES